MVRSATHGDFSGINTHFHAGVIYGVDIQGDRWMAIAKEAANFMVWLQTHDIDRSIQRQFGISKLDWDAFLDSGVVSEEEQKTTLPFFIGELLYERYVENYNRHDIRKNTRAAIEAYLSDGFLA